MNRHYLFFIWSVILHCVLPSMCFGWFNSPTSHSWPALVTPSEIHSQWIAKEIQHNGTDMQILRLSGPLPATDTALFYQNLWGISPAQSHVLSVHDQIIISTIIHHFNTDYQLTLELKANQHYTRGVLSSMRLSNNRIHPAQALNPHLPHGSHIISDTLSIDIQTLNRTVVAQHRMSITQSLFHFENILAEQGWLQDAAKKNKDFNLQSEFIVRFFKNRDELSISLFADQGTKMIVVYIRQE